MAHSKCDPKRTLFFSKKKGSEKRPWMLLSGRRGGVQPSEVQI